MFETCAGVHGTQTWNMALISYPGMVKNRASIKVIHKEPRWYTRPRKAAGPFSRSLLARERGPRFLVHFDLPGLIHLERQRATGTIFRCRRWGIAIGEARQKFAAIHPWTRFVRFCEEGVVKRRDKMGRDEIGVLDDAWPDMWVRLTGKGARPSMYDPHAPVPSEFELGIIVVVD